ncbi:MAG: TetR/AcrR family transcriptional regulator [Spirochaetales bacterium]|nr:TetR/AcrR family transcriptional regulator [Spirochaetales bacterium]
MKTDNPDIIDRIYDETLNLIFSYGAKGWTMDTVCQKSGIAKDTLYRIINNKEELIKNALLKELGRHDEKMKDLLLQNKDFFHTLKDSTALLSDFLEKISLDKLGQIFLQYPRMETAITNGMDDYYLNFANFLEEGKKSGLLKENVDTKLLINFIHSCIMQILKKPEIYNATKDTESLLNYFIEGIKA